jgi:hypothetical protein
MTKLKWRKAGSLVFSGFLIWNSFVIRHSYFVIQSASVQQKSSPVNLRGRLSRKEVGLRLYGVGDVTAGDSAVAAGDSVVVAGLVVSVVVGGLVAAGLATGSVVSVFCSHAARSAAPARIQMYFFIVLIGRGILL